MKTDPKVCVEVFREKKPYLLRFVCFVLMCFFGYLGYLIGKNHGDSIWLFLILIIPLLLLFDITFGLDLDIPFSWLLGSGPWPKPVYECSVCKVIQRSSCHCEVCGAEVGKPFVPKQ